MDDRTRRQVRELRQETERGLGLACVFVPLFLDPRVRVELVVEVPPREPRPRAHRLRAFRVFMSIGTGLRMISLKNFSLSSILLCHSEG